MKTLYLNGLSKVMLGLYAAAIVVGPPSLAHPLVDALSLSGPSDARTKIISAAGTVYILCVCPFIFSAVTNRWRKQIVEIVEK